MKPSCTQPTAPQYSGPPTSQAHSKLTASFSGMLGFTAQRRDPVAALYPLGNGYRFYHPSLMRFCAPDTESPYGPGGPNAYAYCADDPVNRVDPTGHSAIGIFDTEEVSRHMKALGLSEFDIEAESRGISGPIAGGQADLAAGGSESASVQEARSARTPGKLHLDQAHRALLERHMSERSDMKSFPNLLPEIRQRNTQKEVYGVRPHPEFPVRENRVEFFNLQDGTTSDPSPTGEFLYVVRADDPQTIRARSFGRGIGHTSLAQLPGAKRKDYNPFPVHIAGILEISEGRIISANLTSGHYKPPKNDLERVRKNLTPWLQRIFF